METLNPSAVSDIITALIWLFVTTGGALVAVSVWIFNRMADKSIEVNREIGTKLAGIEEQLKFTNATLMKIEKDVRNDLTELDRRKTKDIADIERRISILETRCAFNHGHQ